MLHSGLHEGVPCPCCTPSMKSHQWAMFSGALGDYILSTEVSGIKRPQSEAMQGMLRVCGLIRVRAVDKSQQAEKQRSVVEIMTMCEARLPLFTAKWTRHSVIHFYEKMGWADEIGPSGPLQK